MDQREESQKKPVLPESEASEELGLLHEASPSAPPAVPPPYKRVIPARSAKAPTNNPPRAPGPALVLYPSLPARQKGLISPPGTHQGTHPTQGILFLRQNNSQQVPKGLDDQGQLRGFVNVLSPLPTADLT